MKGAVGERKQNGEADNGGEIRVIIKKDAEGGGQRQKENKLIMLSNHVVTVNKICTTVLKSNQNKSSLRRTASY